ncbi:MAG: bacillithiol biosynthesis cysteine-adding enzyme BshC [Balneolales bacterium]
MKIQDISFSDLTFSTLFCHYTSDFKKVKEFYSADPFSDEGYKQSFSRKTFNGNRDELVEDLKSFNAPFRLEEAAVENIEALRKNDTLTVATGQQMAIYGGPIFTVFKTITTIFLAKRLSATTGKKVVPVFWLADEDHDFEEISGIKLPIGSEIKDIKLPPRENGPSVGRIDISDSLPEFREQVYQLLPDTDFKDELMNLLDDAYESGNLKTGFARLLSSLFSKHGLIFAGSDFIPFKQRLIEPLQNAIINADSIHDVLDRQSSLIGAKYHQQAQIQGTTLFLHTEKHGRVRLNNLDEKWSSEDGQQWDKQEILNLAQNHPELFSPNVFLRPILQDCLLPNIAYVGGPAEIAYYGQMSTVYPMFGIDMPVILPRLSATLVETSIERIMNQLPFNPFDYKARIEDLDKAYIDKIEYGEVDQIFSDWKDEIKNIGDEYIQYISEFDASLKGSAGKETANYCKSIDKLQQKLKRTIKQKEETQLNRIRKIRQHLFPNGVLQEREVSILHFMNKYGINIWDQILDNLESPYNEKHKLIFF